MTGAPPEELVRLVTLHLPDAKNVLEFGPLYADIQFCSSMPVFTRDNAPGLLSRLNDAHYNAGRQVVVMAARRRLVERRLREERARVLLDEVPAELERRKLKPSVAVCEALVDSWPSVQGLSTQLEQIQALHEYLLVQKDAFRLGHQGIRAWLEGREGPRPPAFGSSGR